MKIVGMICSAIWGILRGFEGKQIARRMIRGAKMSLKARMWRRNFPVFAGGMPRA